MELEVPNGMQTAMTLRFTRSDEASRFPDFMDGIGQVRKVSEEYGDIPGPFGIPCAPRI